MKRIAFASIAWLAIVFCGSYLHAATLTWSGNGDPNNSGEWADAANWDGAAVPAEFDTAVLPAPTAQGNSGTDTRTISIPEDQPVTISQLKMIGAPSGTKFQSVLFLRNDFSANVLNADVNNPYGGTICIIDLNGHSLRLAGGTLPQLRGAGELVKTGGGALNSGAQSLKFTGGITLESMANFYFFQRGIPYASSLTVNPRASVTLDGGLSSSVPPPLAIHSFAGRIMLVPAPVPVLYCSSISVDPDPALALLLAENPEMTEEEKLPYLLTRLTVMSGPVSGTVTLDVVVSGTGALEKSGTGRLILAGQNTYEGPTVVSGGILEVTGYIPGDVIVRNGATLRAAPSRIGGQVILDEGAVWQRLIQWTGASSPNDSGLWSDPANWAGGSPLETEDPSQARVILPSVTASGNSGTATRTVTVDVPSVIGDLQMLQSSQRYANLLRLEADLATATFSFLGLPDRTVIDLNGHTFEFGQGAALKFIGGGHLIKSGPGLINFGDAFPVSSLRDFIGTFTVNAGQIRLNPWLVLRSAAFTLELNDATSLELWGIGNVAIPLATSGLVTVRLMASGLEVHDSPITLAADTELKLIGSRLTLNGNITGEAGLTLTGSRFALNGYCTHTGPTILNGCILELGGYIQGDVVLRAGATLRAARWQIGGQIIDEGGTLEETFQWSGGAADTPDPNNDGIWYDERNWSTVGIPGLDSTVGIGAVTAQGNSGTNTRTITLHQPATISMLQMVHTDPDFISLLKLEADLSVGTITLPVFWMPSCTLATEYNVIDLNGRTLEARAGLLPTLSGPGTLLKTGPAALESMSISAGFTGSIAVTEGSFVIRGQRAFPNCTVVTVSSNAILDATSSAVPPRVVLDGGTLSAIDFIGRPTTVTVLSASKINTYSNCSVVIQGELRGSGTLTKIGRGTLVLYDISQFTGDIVVQEGTVDIRDATRGQMTVSAGATITGTGNVAGKLTLADGSSLAPGSSPGSLSANEIVLQAITYDWEIMDPTGIPGVGYDELRAVQKLTIQAATAPIVINVISLKPDKQPGPLASFNPLRVYEWAIARGKEVAGITTSSFSLNLEEFQHPVDPKAFTIYESGGRIRLRYLPGLAGDANMDCSVNILDLIFIRNKLNADVATGDNWKADVNGDARINILDLIYVRNKLNTQCPL